MKRTLVERVVKQVAGCIDDVINGDIPEGGDRIGESAHRIIAMVRRHDARKEKGK